MVPLGPIQLFYRSELKFNLIKAPYPKTPNAASQVWTQIGYARDYFI